MYNISPVLWGSHGWKFAHYVTLAYPDNPNEETKNLYRTFFVDMFGRVLPCESCRLNYKKHLEELPLTDEILSSRNKFIYWFVDIHNLVNDEIGKRKITYDEFNKIYILQEDKKKDNNKMIIIILFLVITLIVLFMLYKKLK